jgi:hypothetical protein
MRPLPFGLLVVAALAGAPRSARADAERTVVKLEFPFQDGGRAAKVEARVTRQRMPDGGAQVKLVTHGLAPKPQSLTLYAGGGDDDGPSDKAIRQIKAQAFDMPDGQKAVRVDLEFVVPGSKGDLQTDTTLIGFVGKPHKLLEIETGGQKARSRTCRETRETQIRFSAGKPMLVEALTTMTLESALGDDDLPVDKACNGKRQLGRTVYHWESEKFVGEEGDDD